MTDRRSHEYDIFMIEGADRRRTDEHIGKEERPRFIDDQDSPTVVVTRA